MIICSNLYNLFLLKMYIRRYFLYNSFSSIKMQRNKWVSRKFVLWWVTIFFWMHIFSTCNIFGTYKQKQGELSTFCHCVVKQASSHTVRFFKKGFHNRRARAKSHIFSWRTSQHGLFNSELFKPWLLTMNVWTMVMKNSWLKSRVEMSSL